MKRVLFLLLTISLLYACKEKHFITDATYRKMVEEDFQKKQEIFGKTPGTCLPYLIPL